MNAGGYPRRGNLLAQEGGCVLDKKSDFSYRDVRVKNSLTGIRYLREYYPHPEVREDFFQKSPGRNFLEFLFNTTGKPCVNFLVMQVESDTSKKNYFFSVVDLTDFSYHIYKNHERIFMIDSYFENEPLKIISYWHDDEKNIVTEISAFEVDSAEKNAKIQKKLEKVLGIYVNGEKILSGMMKKNSSEKNREMVTNFLKNTPKDP